MRATITSAINAVYHHFHCLFCCDDGGAGVTGGAVTTGLADGEDTPIPPATAVGALTCAASVGPPDVEIEPDCHEEEDGDES